MVMLFAWVVFGVHGSSHPLSMTLSAEEPSTNPTIAPVYWCHVPKTGSSFATTLAHFIAPTLDPEVTIRDPTEEMKQYEGLIMADRVARFKSGHAPVAPEDLKKFSGHLVTLVRRPLERTISGFYHDLHDCKSMQQELGCSETNNKTECGSNVTNFKPYAACVRGCTARMLLGYGCGDPNGVTAETHPTLADDAVQVLRTNFGFVGLSDNWAATICLWHARFGGDCLASEMFDTRPGGYDADPAFDDEWEGDSVDEQVYAAGAARFWQEMNEHGLTTPEACVRVCPTLNRTFFTSEVFTAQEAAHTQRHVALRYR